MKNLITGSVRHCRAGPNPSIYRKSQDESVVVGQEWSLGFGCFEETGLSRFAEGEASHFEELPDGVFDGVIGLEKEVVNPVALEFGV